MKKKKKNQSFNLFNALEAFTKKYMPGAAAIFAPKKLEPLEIPEEIRFLANRKAMEIYKVSFNDLGNRSQQYQIKIKVQEDIRIYAENNHKNLTVACKELTEKVMQEDAARRHAAIQQHNKTSQTSKPQGWTPEVEANVEKLMQHAMYSRYPEKAVQKWSVETQERLKDAAKLQAEDLIGHTVIYRHKGAVSFSLVAKDLVTQAKQRETLTERKLEQIQGILLLEGFTKVAGNTATYKAPASDSAFRMSWNRALEKKITIHQAVDEIHADLQKIRPTVNAHVERAFAA